MNLHMKMAVTVASLAGALLLPAVATAAPTSLPIPSLAGVAGLPGPLAPAAQPAANMSLLTVKPDEAVAGTKFAVSASGLPANKDVSIVWNTANVTWMVDARPDSVDYLGRQATKLAVVLGQGKTDAQGALSLKLTAPSDFGGVHDIYAVVDGLQVAHGGFLIADTGNKRIRKVSAAGVITTVAGCGCARLGTGDGGPATAASLNNPGDVAATPDAVRALRDTSSTSSFCTSKQSASNRAPSSVIAP